MGSRPQGKSRRDASRSVFFARRPLRDRMGVATHLAAMAAERPPTRAGLAAGAAAPDALWGSRDAEMRSRPHRHRVWCRPRCRYGFEPHAHTQRNAPDRSTVSVRTGRPAQRRGLRRPDGRARLAARRAAHGAQPGIARRRRAPDDASTAGVEEARVEQVAALIEIASIVEDVVAVNGGAGIGSIVKVQDRGGRSTEYELVGRSLPEPRRREVMLGSPTGKALLGARPGDVVRVTLPNGRSRRVRVINVTPTLAGSLRARAQRARTSASSSNSEIASS